MSSELLPNFKPGPLDHYRNKASFDWKKMKILLDTEPVVKFEKELCNILKDQPDYEADLHSLSFDEERRKGTRQFLIYRQIDLLSLSALLENCKYAIYAPNIMIPFAPNGSVKYAAADRLFYTSVVTMGTDKHHKFLQLLDEGKIFGAFCLTEIAHGSNTKAIRTVAIYDKEKQEFIIHTPDFLAMKCWAGGLGQGATHAVVYAQLYLDGKCYGVHTFIVPVRNPKNLLPYPGVIVGDMGEKIGLNGVDNGFVIFNNYRIPLDNLLNKSANVTPDGKYETSFSSNDKRHGESLGSLSSGRVAITCVCAAYSAKALTIAIRYAAIRKQFGPPNHEEICILEYQNHQYRLLPYLAECYVIKTFSFLFLDETLHFTLDVIANRGGQHNFSEKGVEIHAISCACKSVASWASRNCIQECREACGGHGYLKAAGLGDLRNNNDANCTYEGENHVLIQQTSNWLVKFWPLVQQRRKIQTPMQSADFLTNGLDILQHKLKANSVEEMCQPEQIMDAYQWLVLHFLKETMNKINSLPNKTEEEQFWTKNNTQVFYAKNLAITFIQSYFLARMLTLIQQAPDQNIKNVLTKLFSLYGLWSMEKFLGSFYQGGFIEGPKMTHLVQEGILQLCSEIKDDAVALIDAIAQPDMVINSVLGASDGEVYKRLEAAILSSPYAMSRPKWWQDLVNWQTNVKAKL